MALANPSLRGNGPADPVSTAVRVAPSSSRRHDPEGKAKRLVAAAVHAVAELGYQQATIEVICRRAGVAIGTFYTSFSGKAELFASLAETVPRLTLASGDLGDPTTVTQRIDAFFGSADRLAASAVLEAARDEPVLRAREAAVAAAARSRLAHAVFDARERARRPVTTSDASTIAWAVSALIIEAMRDPALVGQPVAPRLARAIWLQVYERGFESRTGETSPP
ncbi:MAG: Bacterial regulatory protein tetR family [Chloroflexota bacterium]|jgi:AcrR family transcriptional regulator|nr:Bacterial regulatory protein tetR family [Chloroflexota bacterium]